MLHRAGLSAVIGNVNKLTSKKKPERVQKVFVFICPINDVRASGRCFASPGIFSRSFFSQLHRAPLQLDSTAIREFLGILLLIAENTELCKILVASVQTARRNDLKSS